MPAAGIKQQDGREKGIHCKMTHLVNIWNIQHPARNKCFTAGKTEPQDQQPDDDTLIVLFYKEIYHA